MTAPARRAFFAATPQAGIAVMLGALLFAVLNWPAGPELKRTFSTANAEQSEASLPDGTRLLLAPATRVEVLYYAESREILLVYGQAVIDVGGGTGGTFQAAVGSLAITGTGRFALRHLRHAPDDLGVQVAVEKGTLRLARLDEDMREREALLLKAGQQVQTDARGAFGAPQPVPADGIAPWRGGDVRTGSTSAPSAAPSPARR